MRTHRTRPAGDAVRAREDSTTARPAHTSRTVRRNRALRDALAIFEQLGTPLWADRARAELAGAAAGTQTGARRAHARRATGRRTRGVGADRRHVAATLFIRSKTVEATLARVYRKLGIRSRAELGRHMNTIR